MNYSCKFFVYRGLHIRVSHLAIGWHCQLATHRNDPLWYDLTFEVGHCYVFWWQASDNVTIFGCHQHRCSLSSKPSRNCITKNVSWVTTLCWLMRRFEDVGDRIIILVTFRVEEKKDFEHGLKIQNVNHKRLSLL